MVSSFEVGDRVQACVSPWSVEVGTLGRISQTLDSAPDMYFVQFEGVDYPTLMHAAELELLTEADDSYS